MGSVKAFNVIPKELFRANIGPTVTLRGATVRPKGAFDIFIRDGKVHPNSLDPKAYIFPNGVSLRPNSQTHHYRVKALWRTPLYIYSIPAGTTLPNDLVLFHEFRDHYSLQPGEVMTLEELNSKINQFLSMNARLFTKEDWIMRYPGPTERE